MNDYHENHCKHEHEKWILREQKKKTMLENGEFLRCAALCHGNDIVKVIFRGLHEEKSFFMKHKTYDSIPIMELATPADFEKYGELFQSENNDIYSGL